MSIKTKLVLSNIAMIVVPILAFIIVEILLGVFFFKNGINPRNLELFQNIRLAGLLGIVTITNGILTYIVSKSILIPVKQLMRAAHEISEGNLDFKVQRTGKDELGQLAATFDAMRLKLKEANELQNQYEDHQKELIASISHDLKTPITSIKGYIKGIQDGIANTPEKMDRYMDTIFTKANDMDRLINELFLFSKLDLHSLSFDFETIDLNAYFSDFIEELSFELEQEGGTITYDAPSNGTYMARADRDQLKRVIDNIIQNSLKYMDKEQKSISVRLKEETDDVLVQIKDNGSGIPKEDVPFIFDRFYRSDRSRNSATGGSGLGLAIAKRIIEEHGGRIWAESEVGAGTCISFTLKKTHYLEVRDDKNINY